MILGGKRRVIGSEIKSVNVSSFFFVGKIKICSSILKMLFTKCRVIVFESVWPQMKPNKGDGIGRMIDVFQF